MVKLTHVGFSLNKNLEHSSIFDDIRFAVSSRPVMIILALSALLRIVFHFYVLPNSPSGFGPDEGTYAALAKYVSEGMPVEEFPLYGPGLYNSAKSIILPSALLIKLGMAELMAVRTLASVYGLASSLLLVLCFLTLVRLRSHTLNKSSLVFDRKFLALLSIFTFFPSNFVWSTIGLRESGSQFWLITTFYLILKLLESTGRDLWKFTALSSIVLALAHGARPETALIFSLIAVLTSIVLLFKFRQFLPIIAVSLGIFAGQAFTTTPQVAAKNSLSAFRIIESKLIQSATPKPVESNQSVTPKPVESNQSVTPEPVESNQNATPEPVESNQNATPKPGERLDALANKSVSAKCKQIDEVIRFEGNAFRCKSYNTYQVIKRNPAKTLKDQILSTQILEYKRNINTIDAQTALPVSDCQGLSRELLLLVECNSRELPYRFFAFLFRPLVFFDQGSTTLNFAAVENLGWMILVPLAMWISLRKREIPLNRIINLSLTAYVLLFASAAALYEGNLGTAFRHKSTILWPLVFILMIAPRILPKSRKEKTTVS